MMNHASKINIGCVKPPENISAGTQMKNTTTPRIGRPAKTIAKGGNKIAKR